MSNIIVFSLMFTAMLTVIFSMGGDLVGTFDELTDSWFNHQERAIDQLETKITRFEDIPATATTFVQLTWKNEGNVTLARFDDWDVILEVDEDPGVQINYLTYATSTPLGPNEWTVLGLYLDTITLTKEITDPGVFNPGEEMVVLANPFPAVTKNTYHRMRFVTPNGYAASVIFYSVSPNLFLHSETTVLGATTFRNLEDGKTADGTATTTSVTFAAGQTGRVRPTPYDGKFVFPLTSISAFAEATWDMTYRVKRDVIEGPGMSPFNWFTNAKDISAASTGNWVDIDLSSYVPAGTTGAIVEVVNTNTSAFAGVVRGKGDSRDYMNHPIFGAPSLNGETHRWQIVEVDSDRLIQGYIEHTNIAFKLLGYTIMADPGYFTNPPDITPTTKTEWTNVDVTSHVDASADGVILLIGGDAKIYGIREVGSSFNNTQTKLPSKGYAMYLVGLDASKQFQAYVENSIIIYLVGQTKGSVVYYPNDISVTDPTRRSWQQLDADDSGIPGAANGLIFYFDVATESDLGFRNASSTDNWNKKIKSGVHMQAALAIDGDNIWEEYMGHKGSDVQIAAYTVIGSIEAHADIDLLIRKADGSIRDTIGTNIANSPNITGDDWQSLTGSFDFSGYTVVDQTDYLELDLFVEATANSSGLETIFDFDIDNPAIPPDNQPHLQERYGG